MTGKGRRPRYIDEPPATDVEVPWRPPRIKLAPVSRPGADINVTPLVDVVLVLLIIFMVVTPTEEEALTVQLPKEQTTDQQESISLEQVLVTVAGDRLAINNKPVERGAYFASLRNMLVGREPDERIVFIAGTDATPYAALVEVIDAARQAGATSVGLVAENTPLSAEKEGVDLGGSAL